MSSSWHTAPRIWPVKLLLIMPRLRKLPFGACHVIFALSSGPRFSQLVRHASSRQHHAPSAAWEASLMEYLARYPSTRVIDRPDCVRLLQNRGTMLLPLLEGGGLLISKVGGLPFARWVLYLAVCGLVSSSCSDTTCPRWGFRVHCIGLQRLLSRTNAMFSRVCCYPSLLTHLPCLLACLVGCTACPLQLRVGNRH